MVEYSENIIKVVTALLILIFGLLIANILNNIIRKLLRDIEINKIIKEQLKINIKVEEIAASVIKYLIYAGTVIIALNKLGFSTRILQIILLVFILLALVFIALAFKDWIPNLVSGFYIIKNKKLLKGDDITINDIKGKVLQVNLIETKIETNNKEIIFIPNSSITKYKVIKSKNGKGIRSNTIRRNRRKKSCK